MAKNKQQPTGRALSAEQVLEREAGRFKERVERARKELADAEHELERVEVALEAMRAVKRSSDPEGGPDPVPSHAGSSL